MWRKVLSVARRGRQPMWMKRPGMATFRQQNVEDFYEIGEVLGR